MNWRWNAAPGIDTMEVAQRHSLTPYSDMLDRYEGELVDLQQRLNAMHVGIDHVQKAIEAERTRIQSIRIEVESR